MRWEQGAALCAVLQLRQHRLNRERRSQHQRHQAALEVVAQHQALLDTASRSVAEREARQRLTLSPGSRTVPAVVLGHQRQLQASRAQQQAASADLAQAHSASGKAHAQLQQIDRQRAALERRTTWWLEHLDAQARLAQAAADQLREDDVLDRGVLSMGSAR